MNNAGIYCITCNANGKRYIGSSTNISGRLHDHFYKLRRKNHENAHLQRSFTKYGMENFGVKVLLYCDSELRLYFEKMAIKALHPEFNLISVNSERLTMPDETREKISRSMTGRKFSEEHRRNLSKSAYNRPSHPCPEWKKDKQRGSKHSAETIEKMRSSRIGKPHRHSGHPLTPENKKKLFDGRDAYVKRLHE